VSLADKNPLPINRARTLTISGTGVDVPVADREVVEEPVARSQEK
jgi:hypothetical protein